MKKKDWGNAVWFLFHTLAFKLKDEYISELPNLVSHIFIICNNLPCPNCKSHAVEIMKKGMKGKGKEMLESFLGKMDGDARLGKDFRSNLKNQLSLDNLQNDKNFFQIQLYQLLLMLELIKVKQLSFSRNSILRFL